jgi:hypothetical protein
VNRTLTITALLLLPALAAAQVSVNPAALIQLAGIAPPAAPVPVPKPIPAPRHVRHLLVRLAVRPPAPKPAPIIAAPIPPAAIPAVARVAAPKPLAPVTLVFASGSATLPASAGGALKPFCTATAPIFINAHANGDPSDPSVAMRLSLARAFAIRNALTACGLPSTAIIPRALGTVPGQDNDATELAPAK